MEPRSLGESGLLLSPIGFGAFKIGRNEGVKYPSGYDLPDDAAVDKLLNAVLDAGINYIDTAPAYGISEERIGRSIAHRRSEYVLSTKVGETFEKGRSCYDFSAIAVRDSVERSLRRLRTDVLDIVFVHAPRDDLAILDDTDVADTLVALRERGLIRAIGFSGKTVGAAERTLGWADALMIEYHLEDRSHEELIRRAASNGVGVLVKKGLASGRLPAERAVRFVLGNPGVTSMVVGSLTMKHMLANIRSAEDVTTRNAPPC